MSASQKNSTQVLVEALLPTLTELVSEAVKVAMAEVQPKAVEDSQASSKPSKRRRQVSLPYKTAEFIQAGTNFIKMNPMVFEFQ